MPNSKFNPVEYDHDKALEEDLKDPAFSEAYIALEDEFELLKTFLAARKRAHMTQADVAKAMHTSRSTIARIETCGKERQNSPSLNTLRRYAQAVGCKLKLELVPENTH